MFGLFILCELISPFDALNKTCSFCADMIYFEKTQVKNSYITLECA